MHTRHHKNSKCSIIRTQHRLACRVTTPFLSPIQALVRKAWTATAQRLTLRCITICRPPRRHNLTRRRHSSSGYRTRRLTQLPHRPRRRNHQLQARTHRWTANQARTQCCQCRHSLLRCCRRRRRRQQEHVRRLRRRLVSVKCCCLNFAFSFCEQEIQIQKKRESKATRRLGKQNISAYTARSVTCLRRLLLASHHNVHELASEPLDVIEEAFRLLLFLNRMTVHGAEFHYCWNNEPTDSRACVPSRSTRGGAPTVQ